VHAHFGTNPATVALLCRALGGPPWSFTVHGPEEFDRPEQLGLGEKIARAAFAVAVSDFGRSQLCRWSAPEAWERLHVVHCGLDDDFLAAPAAPVPEARRLVCVGRLAGQKGQPFLVEAAARLRSEGLRFEVELVGDGPVRAELEAQIRRRGVGEEVRLVGWADAAGVRGRLRAARAMVLPSLAEGLPVAVMEAFALGRPVISTRLAGIPELVRPGENGWLVTPARVDELVDAMREALTAPVERLEALGRAGRERVAREFRAATEAATLEGLFRGARAIRLVHDPIRRGHRAVGVVGTTAEPLVQRTDHVGKGGKERRRTGFRGRSVAVSRGAGPDVPERPVNPARALRSGTVAGSEADTRLDAVPERE
jgi:glycosyltransferase involved in cell wall biosynthesis